MSLLREDPKLLRAFRAGEEWALERVYSHYLDKVTAVVRYGTVVGVGHVGGAPLHDQHDVIQDTFIRAFAENARQHYDANRDYGPYLMTIARNRVIEYWKRRKREVALPDDFEEKVGAFEASPWLDSETLAAVTAFVGELSPELKGVYEKRYDDSLSQYETAETLGLSRQRVRTLENKLRDGLRKFLQRRENPPTR